MVSLQVSGRRIAVRGELCAAGGGQARAAGPAGSRCGKGGSTKARMRHSPGISTLVQPYAQSARPQPCLGEASHGASERLMPIGLRSVQQHLLRPPKGRRRLS